MSTSNRIEKVNILGVGISAINLDQALEIIINWIDNKEKHYVCITPAHGIMDCQRDKKLQGIFNDSGLTTPDGMSIVWILKIRGYQDVSRVYGPDLMETICCYSSGNRNFRHFFYGGADGVPDKLSKELQNRFPYLNVVGTISPPFKPLSLEEDEIIINQINLAEPDIVWVGISTPKQERWMATHIGRLHAPVIIGVGAAFDFLSGTKKQAPKWIQRSGFEWLFRLTSEPKRLWRRYIEYPKFVILVLIQLLGLKQYQMNNTCIHENHEYNDN